MSAAAHTLDREGFGASPLRFLRPLLGEAEHEKAKRRRGVGRNDRDRLVVGPLPDEVIPAFRVDDGVKPEAPEPVAAAEIESIAAAGGTVLERQPVANHHAIERGHRQLA
jgi:hypothetical protein